MCDNDVASDGGICNLANAASVSEANNEAVFFWCCICPCLGGPSCGEP